MDNSKTTSIMTVFDSEEVAANGSALSDAIDVGQNGGSFSVQVALTGDGTMKLEWLGSLDGQNFLVPNGASEIVTGFTKTSGPGSDGKHIYSFSPSLVKALKLKISETGGLDSITGTVTLAVQ
ncbi:MAG: hypothetical protein JRI80_04840 [Deltaproteobacteria bacterium]|nr:hypothetical protein [Deltaproteobacteria bacterium]